MKRLLVIFGVFAAGVIAVVMPLAGGMAFSWQNTEPARLTVIEKNMTSPTLEELGQKAGDASNVQAPVEPMLVGERKAQWI
jgi:hypothetical protein